jgi:molecular chaperone GrpE (heat shock protein)
VEALEGRTRDLSLLVQSQQQERDTLTERAQQLELSRRQIQQEATERLELCASEAIYLMDLLDWAFGALQSQQHALANEIGVARKEGVRRLAAIGITEIPATGEMDGRLHEGVDTVPSDTIPHYHIVSVVRSGWQWGATVLRRATVVTAVPGVPKSPEQDTPVAAPSETSEQNHECDERGKERESAGQSESRKRRPRASTRSNNRD